MTMTLHNSQLHHKACILAQPGLAHALRGLHLGLFLTSRRDFRQVGLAPTVCTHRGTTANFMDFHPIPRLQASLASSMFS
jgi:hypothetical protein